MIKKIFFISFLTVILICIIFVSLSDNPEKVIGILTPNNIQLENSKTFFLKDFDTFDGFYSNKNAEFAKFLNISEDEAFILGNLGKYWAENLLLSRKVHIVKEDLLYYKFGYKTRFENSAYCIKNNTPCSKFAFDKQLNTIRKGNFVLIDLDTDTIYPISKENVLKLNNYVVIRRSHVKSNHFLKKTSSNIKTELPENYNSIFKENNIKIIVSDLTSKLKPDRNCSSDICKEILTNINNSDTSIDIAIYGYSSTPMIEEAIKNAQKRGVKIRLVYDINSKGENIYPDTHKITELVTDNKNDMHSPDVSDTMHNKFYIFDKKIVITGSANLSHTDMSGFNTNSIIVINSPNCAKIFTNEFEQMYNGKFHSQKKPTQINDIENNIRVYFSPQDKPITKALLPLIKNAKKYIYIPAFIITHRDLTDELIKANNRGVEIKIIADALNASTKHSKHKELRNSGIQLKAENYAGKLHSKTIIIDDEYLITGSMNFSYSGENRNDENIIVLKNSNAAKFYREFFLYQWSRIPDKWLKRIPRAEGVDSIGSCTDGLDNNYDGLTDGEDSACKKEL